MKIGIDCRTILNPGKGEVAGVGHYTFYLVKNLLKLVQDEEIILFFEQFPEEKVINELLVNKNKVKIKQLPWHQYRRYLPFIYAHLLVPYFLKKEKLDVYYNPANIIPLGYRCKSVITIHDLAIYRNPDWFPSNIWRNFFSTKILVPRSVERAEKIIAVSESTKRDLIDIFGVTENKIKVIYEGVEWGGAEIKSSGYLKEKYGVGDNYILYLGTLEPRKNIERLIRVFEELRIKNPAYRQADQELREFELVIAGAKGWKYEKIFRLIDEANKTLGQEAIKYLGYIPAEDKKSLIGNAKCFVFPSFYEGFGLPVLEAMSLSVPVVSSRTSSLPEIVGDTGLLIDPNNQEELKNALVKIMGDENLKQDLGRKALERSKQFSWEKCARETLEVLKGI